jgi:hypothetical protein
MTIIILHCRVMHYKHLICIAPVSIVTRPTIGSIRYCLTIVAELAKKFAALYGPKSCSQEHASSPYPESDDPVHSFPHLFLG